MLVQVAGISVGDVIWLNGLEQVRVTAISTLTLTIQRGYNRTTAQAHSSGVSVTGTRGVYGCLLRDFAVDGASVGTTVDGIRMASHRALIDNVSVQRMTGDGIQIHRGSSAWSMYDTRVRSCISMNNTGSGLQAFQAATDLIVTDNVFASNGVGMTIAGSGSFLPTIIFTATPIMSLILRARCQDTSATSLTTVLSTMSIHRFSFLDDTKW